MRISDWSSDVCSSDLLALEAFDHRGFFAADIGAGAAVDEDVEVVARLGGILAEQAGVIRLLHRREQRLGLADELAANIDIGGTRSEEHTSELQSLMRIPNADFCM